MPSDTVEMRENRRTENEENEENSEVRLRISSPSVASTSRSTPNPPVRTTSLQRFDEPYPFSEPQVVNKWGSRSRNWTLWSVWEPFLSGIPMFEESTPNSDLEIGPIIIGCTQKELTTMVAEVLGRLGEEDEWKQFKESQFIVLLVAQKKIEDCYAQFPQRFIMKVDQAHCETQETRRRQTKSPTTLVAYGGLGSILSSLVEYMDILILFGGYQADRRGDSWVLNLSNKDMTGIVRIPSFSWVINPSRLFLMERIQPGDDDQIFKFTYKGRKGKAKNGEIRYKRFSREHFRETGHLWNPNINGTFQIPIVRGVDPTKMFDSFFPPIQRPPISLPQPSSSSPGLQESGASGRFQSFQHDDNTIGVYHWISMVILIIIVMCGYGIIMFMWQTAEDKNGTIFDRGIQLYGFGRRN